MEFSKRTRVVSCCMHLHNYCINRSVEEEILSTMGPLSEIVPGRWEITPLFDDSGRPVEYLNTTRTKPLETTIGVSNSSAVSRDATRRVLIDAIRETGLVRPARKPYPASRS